MTERNTPDEDRDDRAERALRDALQQHADEPDFQPMELPKTVVSRSGLPRWLPAAAAVVLVAAVAIPLAISRFSGSSPSSAVPAAAPESGPSDAASNAEPTASAPVSRPGWRWESYRVLSYQVPTTWGYGYAPDTAWCVGEGRTAYGAIVDMASETRAVPAILCPRAIPLDRLPMFVSVRSAGAADRGWDLPSGWGVASTELNGYRLEVVHPDKAQEVADEIVASVRPIAEVDPNGCVAAAAPRQSAQIASPDRVSLCQYERGVDHPLLASTVLTGERAANVVDALMRAPVGSGPDGSSCAVEGDVTGETEVIARLWQGSNAQDVRVRYAACEGNGITGLGDSRKLTAEACQAIMVPPIAFTSGKEPAAKLCWPAPTPSAVAPSTKPGKK